MYSAIALLDGQDSTHDSRNSAISMESLVLMHIEDEREAITNNKVCIKIWKFNDAYENSVVKFNTTQYEVQ